MSTISFTTSKQGVQDLLAALPTPATPANELSRGEDLNQEPKPGFNDLLRDSSQTQQTQQRSDAGEPIDTQPRPEAQQDEKPNGETTEAIDQEASTNDSSDDEAQQPTDENTNDQNAEQASNTSDNAQPQETSSDAELQAAANAAANQLNLVDVAVNDQAKAKAQSSTYQQIDLTQVKQVTESEQTSEKNQSTGQNLSLNAALPNQTQSPTGQAVQADSATAVQPLLQQGDTAQTGSGDARGDSKSASASTATSTAASSTANASAATVFTLPDQVSGDSRLPIQTTTATLSADTARQAQAQTAISSADNDSLNTARLTRGLANAVQQRGGAVTLRLTPPEMGTVRIQMQISGTSVSASFHAESSSAQTLLTNQLAQLRSSLESKGMSVDRLSVQPLAATTSSQNSSQAQNQSDSQQQGQPQQQSGNDGRSRGQYNGHGSGQQSPSDQQDGGANQQNLNGFFDQLSDAEQAA